MVGRALDAIFGGEQVGDKVKNFDFSPPSKDDNGGYGYGDGYNILRLQLAPSYGLLNRESIKNLDGNLKAGIVSVVKLLGRVRDRNWDTINDYMRMNPFLDEDPPGGITRREEFIRYSSSDFDADGNPNATVVQEVKVWLDRFVNDRDISESIKIDNEVVAKIVARALVLMKADESGRYEDLPSADEMTLVDICVLRFPDSSNPCFQVFRLRLEVVCETSWQSSINGRQPKRGIAGEINLKTYKLDIKAIEKSSSESRARAAQEADGLFD